MGTIIVASDGSQAAASAAQTGYELARQTGDEVVIVVVREPVRGAGYPFAYYDETFLAECRGRPERVLDAALAEALEAGIAATGTIRGGDPVAEICALAAETDARMVVVGTHGWGPLRSFILGSVAAGVLAGAPCPVLAGQPGSKQPALTATRRQNSADN